MLVKTVSKAYRIPYISVILNRHVFKIMTDWPKIIVSICHALRTLLIPGYDSKKLLIHLKIIKTVA